MPAGSAVLLAPCFGLDRQNEDQNEPGDPTAMPYLTASQAAAGTRASLLPNQNSSPTSLSH